MTVRPITARDDPACFGVCCAKHQRCARYAAVEQSSADPWTIATCEDSAGRRPLFIAIEHLESADVAAPCVV